MVENELFEMVTEHGSDLLDNNRAPPAKYNMHTHNISR